MIIKATVLLSPRIILLSREVNIMSVNCISHLNAVEVRFKDIDQHIGIGF